MRAWRKQPHIARFESRQHPPLDANLFDKASDLKKKHPLVGVAIDSLRASIETDGSFDDPWTSRVPLRMEQFFADVYYDVATRRSTTAFEVYLDLLKLYGHVLGATTNWMGTRTDDAIIGRFLRSIVAGSRDERPVIISFNQDLLVENSVYRMCHDDQQWCLNDLYGTAELSPLQASGDLFPHHSANCRHESPLELLKLHGSFNWILRTRDQDPRPETLFPRRRDKRIYVHNLRQLNATGGTMRTPASPGRTVWYTWPLVIPPIYDKQRITGITLLDGLWSRAAAALENAERIIVFGYSMPESDVLARQMFRRSYARNSSLGGIEVINPDVEVAARLKGYLGCGFLNVWTDAETFLARS